MVEEVKRSSSKWIKSLGPSYHDFSWQEGYGAFSVSQSKVETVTRYILGQKEHHKKMTFQDELKMFLKEYQVEYNEETAAGSVVLTTLLSIITLPACAMLLTMMMR